MSEATYPVEHSESLRRGSLIGRVTGIAWRNLWRNRRRTWLTAVGIAFAIWMLVFARSAQDGTFVTMVDNAARMFTGHVQYQHPEYMDNPRLEFTIHGAEDLRLRLLAHPDVAHAVVRAQSFALVSADERSFGGQVMGVVPELESPWSSIIGSVAQGRYLERTGEVFMGSVLARNLGVVPGDDVVMLGTGVEGGVAAAAGTLVGTFTSGQIQFDRTFVQIHLDDFRAGWELGPDEAHTVIAIAQHVDDSAAVARLVTDREDVRALSWQELMPGMEQMVDLKIVSTDLFFALIAVIVTFSVVNTFMMTTFERTPEFGMLMAVGMRPRSIMVLLQVEALWLCLLGIALGVGSSLAMIVPLSSIGIPLPAEATEVIQQYNIPDRMYPAFNGDAAWTSSIIMLIATQIAAVIPALRIRTMKVVEALRGRE
ncbi:MAG: FtsX-like permease family protein [Pseudomonadales bacterium]|jgi:ABC-type lipoprotein release transport system permease subunit|nr:FtsX-like permease family protein [Pseudomonadales bacterium]MDP6471919.1 FtsX-like permease family protein [Pseudomonadales bacterium]MDP6826811.1 FtsX-like permease family protein [Pseudomonadales bacterium]MDP6970911.1 FtsX-like permease family protein [Pseudomonadales bacterium]|tara:strand:- start:163 stop:1440 length:1278 start_codon:yes stop_codon:yes gene_type:complete